jgi:1-deoxy-D-xylulose 5-phosphate reductoisomerase
VLNAANEVAVAAFLDRRIRFDQIHHVNLATLEALAPSKPAALEGPAGLDGQARRRPSGDCGWDKELDMLTLIAFVVALGC